MLFRRWFIGFILINLLILHGSAVIARDHPSGPRTYTISREEWVEEWNPATQQWERVSDNASSIPIANSFSYPSAAAPRNNPPVNRPSFPLAVFGPFHVISNEKVVILGATNGKSLDDFSKMMEAFPGIRMIEFRDAAGTTNDLVNLSVGRAIRSYGLATYIPPNGSARSGAVELFIAGTRRSAAPDAMFAVHSWRDEKGREPVHLSPDDPSNLLYINYYVEMGMDSKSARAFYDMTNSVPHVSSIWLDAVNMTKWLELDIVR